MREFIYPYYSEEIERELREHGIRKAYSFGSFEVKKGIRALGKGKTGIVVLTEDLKAVKIRRVDSPKESLEIEAKLQGLAFPVAPKVYDYGRNFILMDYIKGRHMTRQDINLLPTLVIKAWKLEGLKIEHKELSRPWKNVIVRDDGDLVVLDFDSATIKESPKNVTSVLSAFGLVELAKTYARTRDLGMVLDELKLLASPNYRNVFEVRNI